MAWISRSMALGLLAVVLAGCSGGPRVGSKAPSFNAPDTNGRSVSLDDYRGKTVVLYFWAVWCPPCATSGPEIQKLHETFSERDVAVLRILPGEKGFTIVLSHFYCFPVSSEMLLFL